MSRIKILFTIPNFDTAGSGQVLLNIAQNLNKDEFEVHICCNHGKGAYYKVVEATGIPIHIAHFTADLSPKLGIVPSVIKIAKFFKTIKPDIIHSFHWSSDFTEGMAAKLAGAKWIYTKKNMGWKSRNWKLRTFFADGIVTINPFMKYLYFPTKKNVHLIPCSVDIDKFKAAPRDPKIREAWGFTDNHQVIISVANLVPEKGIENLILAFEMLEDENVRLVFVGNKDNDYGVEMEQLVREKKLEGKVLFLGKKLDVTSYLIASDLFVIPTRDIGRSEALGVALLEAMATGLLVLGSEIDGIKFILQDLPELLFDPENTQELATRIKMIFELNDTEKEEIKGRLQKVITDGFLSEKEVSDHTLFYKKILKKS